MAETSKVRRGEIQQAILQLLSENPDGLQAKEVITTCSRRLTLSEYEQSDYPNRPGVRRFDKIARFLTIGPVKAGWLEKEKGVWTITDQGIKALKEFSDPLSLAKESGRLYRKWRAKQPQEEGVESDAANSTAVEEAEEIAWTEISEYLAEMNPYDFQDLVGGLLEGMGYHIAWISPPGPDKGIDILAYSDPLGVGGPRIKVQVKRTPESKINASGLRSFMATLGDNDVGLFVASGGFSREAEKEAREQEKRRITLLDLQSLFDLWVRYYETIPQEAKLLLPIQPVHFLAPDS